MKIRNKLQDPVALSREKQTRVPIHKKQGETTVDLKILRTENNLVYLVVQPSA